MDLEDAGLLRKMFALFHGTPPDLHNMTDERRVMPASPAVRAQLVGLFSRSITASSIFPDNLRVREGLISINCCMHRDGIHDCFCSAG